MKNLEIVHVILARDEKCYLADTGLLDKPALSRRHNVSPVEVKSGSNLTHSSMDKFARKFKECLSERFMIYDKDVRTRDGMTCLPFYMVPLLTGNYQYRVDAE